jgi:antagonist of KipI
MNTMRVDKAGAHSLLQDSGRYGYQRFGVPVNGAMDEWSHRVANALVGNDDDAATLECTLIGPTVRFAHDTLIALTGADMHASAGGVALPRNRAVMLRHDVPLVLGRCATGARGYLAVRGGVAPPPVMESRSTHARAGYGGFEGRALRAGDRVPVASPAREMLPLARLLVQSGMGCVIASKVSIDALPGGLDALRFIPGPQWDRFGAAERERFVTEPFTVSAQSDRMGYRLDGPALMLTTPLEMISEAVNFGTVQVPPSGDPIVLMADRQSAGGYPKLAYVITADLPALAQALPGDELRFRAVTQDEAERLCLAMEDRLAAIAAAAPAAIGLAMPNDTRSTRHQD